MSRHLADVTMILSVNIAPLHIRLYLPIPKESYNSATEYGASSISVGSPPMILPLGKGGNIDAPEKKNYIIRETLTLDKINKT